MAGQVGAGLTDAPLTMEDQYAQAQALARQGYSMPQIRQALNLAPAAGLGDDAAVEEPAAMGTIESYLNYGPRRALSSFLEGTSGMVEDYDGNDTLGGVLDAAADFVGPSDDQEERAALRAEERGFAGDVIDAIGQEAPTLAATIGVGMAAGSVVPGAGTVVGGLVGAAIGVGRMYDQGRDNVIRGKVAEKLGKRPDDVTDEEIANTDVGPLSTEEKARVGAVGALGLVDAFPASRIIGKLRPQMVTGIAQRSLLKAGGAEALKVGSTEGAMEFGQELGTMLLTDEQLRQDIAKLPEGDILALGEHIAKTKGRDLAVSFLAGFGLGGGVGGAAGAAGQNAQNSYIRQRVAEAAAIGQSRGVSPDKLDEVAKDPAKVSTLQSGVTEIGNLQEIVNAYQREYDSAPAEAKPLLKKDLDKVNDRLERKIDETFGKDGLNIEGFKDTAAVRQERKEAADRKRAAANERLTALGIKAPDDIEPDVLYEAAEKLSQAAADVEAAQERLANTNAKRREKRQKDLDEAIEREAKVRSEVPFAVPNAAEQRAEQAKAVKAETQSRADAEAAAAKATAFDDKVAAYEAELEMFEDPKEREKVARQWIRNNKKNPDRKLRTQLATQRKALDDARRSGLADLGELGKMRSAIADLEGRIGTANPAVVAAERLLQGSEEQRTVQSQPQGGEAARQGDTTTSADPGTASPATPTAAESEVRPANPETAPAAAPLDMTNVRNERIDDYHRARRDGRTADMDIAADAIIGDLGLPVTPETRAAFNGGPKRRSIKGRAEAARAAAAVPPTPAPAAPAPAVTIPPVRREQIREGYGPPEAPWRDLTDRIDVAAGMEAHEATMRQLMDEGLLEYGASYDAAGNLLGFGTNDLYAGVGWPTTDWETAAVFTHSHPMLTPFSRDDVDVMRRQGNLQAVRAVIRGANTIEMRPTAKLRAMSADAFDNWYARNVSEPLKASMRAGAFPTGASLEAQARLQQEAALQIMEAQGLIDYVTPLEGFSQTERDAINDVVFRSERAGDGLGSDGRPQPAEGGAGRLRTPEPAPGEGAVGDPQGRPRAAPDQGPRLASGQDPVYPEFDAAFRAGTPVEDLQQRPEFVNAVGRMLTMPPTSKRPGFDTPEWHASRQYQIEGRTVVGTAQAIPLMVQQARDLAAIDLRRTPKPTQNGRVLTIVTGPPASGKSTIANEIAYDTGAAIVDSDAVKATLPEFGRGEGANAVHKESKVLAETVEAILSAQGANIVYPKVGHEAASIEDLARRFKAMGYKVNVVNLNVPSAEAMRRMLGRFGQMGRLIPPSYLIDEVGDNPNQVHKQIEARGEFDGYAELDGLTAYGEKPRVLSQSGGDALAGTPFAVPGGSPAQRGQGGAQPGAAGDLAPALAAGLDLARTANEEPLPGLPADPARIRDLTRPIFEAVSQKSSPKGTDLERSVINGELTNASMDAGLRYAAHAVAAEGTEASTVVLQAARLMFPKAKLDPKSFVKEIIERKDGKKTVRLEMDPDWKRRMNAAWQFLRRVGQDESMGFGLEKLPMKQKNGFWDFEAQHFVMNEAMQDYLQISPPEKALFTRPMEDPDDTSAIVRNVKTNAFLPEAIDRMRATAAALQRNVYYLDQQAIAALTPDDLISDKKLGEQLMKRNAAGEIQLSDDPTTRAAQEKFLRTQRFRQKKKLSSLRRMAEIHGDQPVGYRYRVDDKGRIYADGMFTPQTGDFVKGVLRVGTPDGPRLSDMPTVDHSASGWQMATLMTRDAEAASWFNLGSREGEQPLALQEGYKKRDMYDRLMADLRAQIERDAVTGEPKIRKAAALFKERVFDTGLPFGKVQIKPAVIAVNYAGGRANFQERLLDVYGEQFRSAPAADRAGLWGYASAAAYDQLRAKAPDTMRFQDWAIENLTALVEAVEGKSDPLREKPKLKFSVGLDGQYAKLKPVEKQIVAKANDGQDSVQQTVDVPTNAVDARATARSIYSQIIQGFDASVLHRAIAIYKANGDDFVTSNHDSYTIPEGNAGRMAAATREAMKQIMTEAGDVPARLRREIEEQAEAAGISLENLNDPTVFNEDGSFRYGSYDLNMLDTAVPVFVENAGDIAPALTDLQGNLLPGAPAAPAIARGIDYDAAETGAMTGVRLATSLPKAAQFAQDSQFSTGRDLKVALQEMSLQAQLEQGIDLSTMTEDNVDRLGDFLVEDAKAALVDNRNAIGWYGRTVDAAKSELAKIYPELLTDPDAEFAFTWALAVTSNGLKVDKNFELAAKAYDAFKATGSFPANIGIGQSAANINEGLAYYQKLVDKLGSVQAARDFMVNRQPVRDIERISGISVTNEGKAEMLPGAVILGPKIGGGFFSNLYGNFDELTMDRWFMRTLGRWRGTLIEAKPEMEAQKQDEMRAVLKELGQKDLEYLRGFFNGFPGPVRKTMSAQQLNDLAQEIAKRSVDPGWRSRFNAAVGGERMRKVGNMLAKYIDGQVEMPSNTKERQFIRKVFRRGLDRLRAEPDMQDLTMSDLQALLWYPEKTLYETAKKPVGQEAKGYADEDAPDYANAARKLVRNRLGQAGRDGARPDTGDAGAEPSFGPALHDVPLAAGVDGSGSGQGSGQPQADGALVRLAGGIDGGLPGREVGAREFSAAMSRAALALGPEAAQVSRVPDDANVQRFLLDDGMTGYALDGDNVIGVFSTPGAPRGAAQRVLADAVARGGRRLDGFDTYLPKIYAKAGFRAVARLPFNPEYAPSLEGGSLANWSTGRMRAAGRRVGAPNDWGTPDVVFMVYDPANASPDTDNLIGDYDDGIAAQDRALQGGGAEEAGRIAAAGQGGAGSPGRSGDGPRLAAGIDDWIGRREGASNQKVKAEITRLVEVGRSSPNSSMAALRHASELFSYDQLMNRATKADGKDYGPQFMTAHAKFTRGMVALLAQIAKDAPPAAAAHYMQMVKAQKNDHITKLREGLQRGTIEVSQIDLDTKLFKVTEPALARGITAPEGIDLGLSESGVRQTYDAVVNVAANPGLAARTALERVEDNFFNRFAPIRRLERTVKGKLGTGMESAFKAAETAVNDSGRNEALMYYGAAKLGKYGEYSNAPGTVGLRTIFDTAVEGAADKGQAMADWMGYMVGQRILDLRKAGFTAPFPMSDAEAQKYVAAATPKQKQAAAMWRAHNDANIDFLVDAKRITKEQADAMKAAGSYVPFYRSQQNSDGSSPEFDLGDTSRFGRGGGAELLARDPGIKALKGGDKKAIDNIMINMIRNSQAMVAAGMRNHAANLTFDLMEGAGLAKAVKGSAKKKPHGDAVAVWRDGKKKWVIPQPGAEHLVIAMAGLQPLQLGRIQALLGGVGAVFRQGITLSPAFMVRNLIRGAVSNGLLTSGANLTAANNTLTGLREAWNNSQATQAFKAQSGMGDYSFGNPSVGLGANDILIEYGLQPKTMGFRIRKAIEAGERVGTATELADRVASYKTMIARGMRPDEAAYQARAIMDYARKGANPELRAWLPMVPFLNARLQGYSRLAEGAVGRGGEYDTRGQAAKQLALNGLVLMALSGALWARNAMDEEREEKYKAEPLWKRLNYHIVYLGDRTLLIPKAFELGHLFSSIPELFADAMVNDMNEIGQGVRKIALDTIGFNLIPAAVLPIIEASANYSFFTGAPIEGRRELGLRAEDRIEGSSAISRFVGQQLGISDLTKISPTMIEHWAAGYGGAYFLTAAAAVDVAASETGLGSAPVGGAFGDVPVASAALQRSFGSMLGITDQKSTKFIEEFYRNKDFITQVYRSAKDAAARGDVEHAQRLLEKAPGTAEAYKIVNRAASQLSEINRGIRDVRNDRNLSPAEKRAKIAPLVQARNRLVAEVSRVIDGIEEQQGRTFRSAA
jgi:adenylate kinase family enzyme